MITIGKLGLDDRAAWEKLFRGYTAFYQEDHPQSVYDRAWDEFQADERMHALGAWLDGSLVGIVHFFPHPQTTGTCGARKYDSGVAWEVTQRRNTRS